MDVCSAHIKLDSALKLTKFCSRYKIWPNHHVLLLLFITFFLHLRYLFVFAMIPFLYSTMDALTLSVWSGSFVWMCIILIYSSKCFSFTQNRQQITTIYIPCRSNVTVSKGIIIIIANNVHSVICNIFILRMWLVRMFCGAGISRRTNIFVRLKLYTCKYVSKNLLNGWHTKFTHVLRFLFYFGT